MLLGSFTRQYCGEPAGPVDGLNKGMSIVRVPCAAIVVAAAGFFGTAAVATTTPVPAHFEPASVSFISASTGFVLGTSPCPNAPCSALLSTVNGGKTWAVVTAPPAPFAAASSPSSASVSQVVFASATDGWVYGPTLWATYNAAASWAQVKLGGPVYLLATSAQEAYAVVGTCSPGANNCPRPGLRLARATVGSSVWHSVPRVSGYGTTALLTVNGSDAWVSFRPSSDTGAVMIWGTANDGSTWRRLPDPCYQPSEATDLAGMASPGDDLLFELCAGNPGAGQEGKSLRASSNGGTTSHVVSHLPLGGLAWGIAAPSSRDVLVTAVSGASFVYRSTNAGSTWATQMFRDGGEGFYNFAFATPSFGATVEGNPIDGPPYNRLLETDNGGATWSPVHI